MDEEHGGRCKLRDPDFIREGEDESSSESSSDFEQSESSETESCIEKMEK